MSINHVAVSGNLTRDPELRSTASGTQVMNFSVAVNDRRRNQQTGEWEDHPNYIDCVVFGARAQRLSTILHKGGKVAIQGKLRQNTWNDQQTGQRRSKIEVMVDDIDLMQQRGTGRGGYQTNPQPTPQQSQAYQQPAPEPTYRQARLVGSDDAPF